MAATPPPPPSQDNDYEGDQLWKSDDERDMEDYEYEPPSPFMVHFPGSLILLVSFMTNVRDWSVLDTAALYSVLKELPVPIAGPVSTGKML